MLRIGSEGPEALRILVIVLLAYLITGAYSVWHDLRESNPIRAPIWVSKYYESPRLLSLLPWVLLWLPFATLEIVRLTPLRFLIRRELKLLLFIRFPHHL